MTVAGADSATPQPQLYAGHGFWGFYVADHSTTYHVWSQDEVKALAGAGVSRGLPITVAPLGWPFSLGVVGELSNLIREAITWGVPKNVPLVLDFEESLVNTIQAQLGGNGASAAIEGCIATWTSLCASVDIEGWSYGPDILEVAPGFHWRASWLDPVPTTPPDVPAGYSAWQYAGNQDGGDIDYDVMTDTAFARLMLTATLKAPAAPPPPPPPPPPKENDMGLIVKGSKGGEWLITGGLRVPIHTPEERAVFVASGAKDAPDNAGWTDGIIAKFPVNTDTVKHVL